VDPLRIYIHEEVGRQKDTDTTPPSLDVTWVHGAKATAPFPSLL
jgi:hypothetical protein